MYVSVSAYNDADVLAGALASVREFLPDAEIVVIDGRYGTWPDDRDNSTDRTPEVAQEYAAGYVPAGPFDREVDKHRFRVGTAPEEERVLFLDADERIIALDEEKLPEDRPVQPRIFNPVVYNRTPISYWPRIFYPEQVEEVNRWDAYIFTAPPIHMDEVTLYHRHDLRPREYREAKYQRFRNEDRMGRYERGEETMPGVLEEYLGNTIEPNIIGTCPECGEESVVESPVTNRSRTGSFSKVRACLTDGCWSSVDQIDVGGWKYLPDRVEVGLDEDPERLRFELVDAGCTWLREVDADYLLEWAPTVMAWVRQHEDELEPPA